MGRLHHLAVAGYPYMVTTVIACRAPVLAEPAHAQIVMDSLFHGRAMGWWKLAAFVVMPDHLHMMIVPTRKSISECVKAVKGYSARLINARLKRSGTLWQAGFFDYVLDTEEKALNRIRYIENNPVRKGLVVMPEEYIFSSSAYAGKMDRVF
jgi:putative transposase